MHSNKKSKKNQGLCVGTVTKCPLRSVLDDSNHSRMLRMTCRNFAVKHVVDKGGYTAELEKIKLKGKLPKRRALWHRIL